MVLLEFSMSPFAKGESLSPYVARSLDIIDKSGLPYQLTPMGTIIEGEWAEVMAVVTACFEAMQRRLRAHQHPDQDRLPRRPRRAHQGEGRRRRAPPRAQAEHLSRGQPSGCIPTNAFSPSPCSSRCCWQ
jgi:uncharacterized protein (TIGR00106 family)